MRKAALIFLILLFWQSAPAQEKQPHKVKISPVLGLGPSFPHGPGSFPDWWKIGVNGLAGVGFKIAPSLELIGKLEYFRFSTAADYRAGRREVRLAGLDINIMTSRQSPRKFFIVGGIGWARVDTRPPSSVWTLPWYNEQESSMYADIGLGAELGRAGNWRLFGQGRIIRLFTEGENLIFLPVTIGLKF